MYAYYYCRVKNIDAFNINNITDVKFHYTDCNNGTLADDFADLILIFIFVFLYLCIKEWINLPTWT